MPETLSVPGPGANAVGYAATWTPTVPVYVKVSEVAFAICEVPKSAAAANTNRIADRIYDSFGCTDDRWMVHCEQGIFQTIRVPRSSGGGRQLPAQHRVTFEGGP